LRSVPFKRQFCPSVIPRHPDSLCYNSSSTDPALHSSYQYLGLSRLQRIQLSIESFLSSYTLEPRRRQGLFSPFPIPVRSTVNKLLKQRSSPGPSVSSLWSPLSGFATIRLRQSWRHRILTGSRTLACSARKVLN
jgi:hypothetical protein